VGADDEAGGETETGDDEVMSEAKTDEAGSEVFDAIKLKVELTEQYEGKVAAVGKEVASVVKGLWLMNSEDIQRRLVETVIEAQRNGDAKVKFSVPMKVVFDLEKDLVTVGMQWRGPARKRAADFTLSEVEPLLPGMEGESL